ncbi:MAG: hypothetical protein D6780_00315 [Candidatus Dadabacteria bacterium]|nr:MAG: hypothetical protein D6780_00315 [Candidatus Dadabacteria bacterium]
MARRGRRYPRRKRRGRERKRKEKKIGGIGYALSLAALVITATVGVRTIFSLFDSYALSNILKFSSGAIVGGVLSAIFIRGHLSVAIHEFKHAVVSLLVGNKWKKMVVHRESGYFEYEYSKDAEEYNAMISLAPYWLPIFTVSALVIYYFTRALVRDAGIAVIGAAWAADTVLGFRDVSPRQTDFSKLTGGFIIGLIYVIAAYLTYTTVLISWIMQGSYGPLQIFYRISDFVFALAAYYIERAEKVK